MLLHPATLNLPPNGLHKEFSLFCSANSVSLSSGFLKNPPFLVRKSVSFRVNEQPLLIACSSISDVYNYGTVDYENRRMPTWHGIFKKLSAVDNENIGVGTVLNQVENAGKYLSKWELCRIVKELRKFKRYISALEVYDWMSNREERFRINTSDTAIQLDLIAKVHGISRAEEFFFHLPDGLKDKRIYGSLLNVYVRGNMQEKAEALMDKIRNQGYASQALSYNVMMTLYMKLKDHGQIESLVTEMKENNVALDIYSYNIWLSSCGLQGSVEKMEQVFSTMETDSSINPNWTTFSSMASMYLRLGHFEKAMECLKKVENRLTGQDRTGFHFLISLYGTAGKKDEVYRVWNLYKSLFTVIPNLGYRTMISALIRMDEIEEAEKVYDEWLTVKTMFEPRVGNLLLGFYLKNGQSQKIFSFFNRMLEVGGKPNAMTWEILAEDHIQNRRIPEALSCLQNAVTAESPRKWFPKPMNIAAIIKISEQDGDTASKEVVFELLEKAGCLGDTAYMSDIPLRGDAPVSVGVSESISRSSSYGDEHDESYGVLHQLEESL